MKTTNRPSPPLLLLLLIVPLLLPSNSIATAHRLDHELSLAISALRSHGYNLFPDALAESNNLLLLLRGPSRNSTLTIFSPPDSSLLFPPSVSVLLFRFVSPFRLLASRLRILSSGTCLNTLLLLPHHHLSIQRAKILLNGTVSDSVTVDGMGLSLPDLFIGSSIAVHGLHEILAGGFESKALQIEKAASPYISSWAKTGLFRSKNGTNRQDTEIIETGIPWID